MDRKDTNWNRIGLAAAVVLVPGGFLLGAALLARRYRQKSGGDSTPMPDARDDDPATEPTISA
ncbi:hypothetical protein [Sphingomonas echinoides]|uniref:Uncharacterized protein n=1 Tax=Sphingomonas echinoides TaxID=59803 RepID=A0ABU4PI47_9SPHN|nr:hypothetical protein [Sphingomonas echinoides]MDX5982807.1 hypothetical protein [Sphingomonas echinoides]